MSVLGLVADFLAIYFILFHCWGETYMYAEADNSASETKVEALVRRIENLEATVEKQSATIDKQTIIIQHLLHKSGKDLEASSSARSVAFTAYLDRIVTNSPANAPIPFNRVLLNEGSGYDVTRGKFTAPQKGVYMFTFGIENDSANHIVTKLIVNGDNQVNAVNGQYQNGGNTAVVRLAVGEQAWVAVNGGNATIWNTDGFRYSTFSGVYLFE